MSSPRKVSRREAILVGAAVVASGGAAVMLLTDGSDSSDSPSVAGTAPATASTRPAPTAPPTTLPQVDLVAAVGSAYLAAYPDDADEAGLQAAVPEISGTTKAERLAALPMIAERAREDFRDRTTVVVDGWVLARSEAQAAALVSLGR